MTYRSRRAALSVTTALALAAGLLTPATAAHEAQAATTVVGAQECETSVTFGYYRMWRDVATTKPEDREPNVQRLDDVPAAIDIVSLFATKPEDDPDMWEAVDDHYADALHAQGTELVFTLWVSDLADADIPLTEAAYEEFADELVDTYIDGYGIDGLDIDVEESLSGDRLGRAVGIVEALGERLGPQSGTDDYLIIDTNMTGSHPFVQAAAPLASYVLLQAYGRGAATLQSAWETFDDLISSCQFLVGFSFYEEHGFAWGDTAGGLTDSTAYDYAAWQPDDGDKGGFFAYAIDRDGKVEGDDTITRTTFDWMSQLDLVADASVG